MESSREHQHSKHYVNEVHNVAEPHVVLGAGIVLYKTMISSGCIRSAMKESFYGSCSFGLRDEEGLENATVHALKHPIFLSEARKKKIRQSVVNQ